MISRIPDMQAIIMIAIFSIVTILLRAIPFILFPGNKKTPAYINYLGKVLPPAIIGMLVIYCMKDVAILSAPFGIPEAIATVAIVLVHVWKRNTLLSIGGGTVLYMFLVQVIFR